MVLVGGPAVLSAGVADRVRALLPGVSLQRRYGVDRYATAASLAVAWAPGSAPTVVLSSGMGFADALAAGSGAAAAGAPLLLTPAGALPAATAAQLDRLNPQRIVIVGGPAVVSAAVADAVRAYAPAVERASGANRYATAVAVADRFYPGATAALVSSGEDFPDALAAAPLAAALTAPLLLVQPTAVPAPTQDAFRARKPTTIVVLGGSATVSGITFGEVVGWADGRLALPAATPSYPTFDARYHDFGEVVTMIRAAEIAYPDIVRVFSIGKSHQGRDIWVAKISDNVGVDEDEPEVLFDALHHAREHLTVEQALFMLSTLAQGYSWSPEIRRLVDTREIFIVFALNPDGWAYDLSGGPGPYVGWRKNRQPNPGSSYLGTDLNRNYDYRWACCGGSSSSPADWNYHGQAAWSATETRVLRDFVLSRRINGEQQIRTHVTLHTNGELILWPFGYTKTDIPSDMQPDDHAAFVAMGKAMAAMNGYTSQQSSDLYITDGDQIDWMYATQGIFSFTFELYPTEQVSSHADHEPPDEVIAAQTARNKGALLYLIDMADCPYRAVHKEATYCP